jgi:hypothetical protein
MAQAITEESDTYASGIGAPTIYTDYVVVGETKSAT